MYIYVHYIGEKMNHVFGVHFSSWCSNKCVHVYSHVEWSKGKDKSCN